MARNGFKIMDSDMHVMEPPDLWQTYTDPAFRDRAPVGLSRFQGDMMIEIGGQTVPYWRAGPRHYDWQKHTAEEQDSAYKHSYERGWDSATQVRAMEMEGLDVAFLYPSRGLYALAVDGMDPDLGAAIATAYNRWMFDFCAVAPERMFGASMVSAFDVESAVTEARSSVRDQGMKAVFIRPNIVNGRNWHDPYYDPLWAEIESLGVPLGFHEGASARLPQVGDRLETYMMHHTVCHPVNMMLAVVSFIGGGILERFPKLNVGFLEANCGWAPWLVWRLDEHYELSGKFESPELRLEPREYFLRQCFVSVEVDESPADYLETTGLSDTVVFSTDYPHNDSKFPNATDTFMGMPLSQDFKRKILWDNCARMYNFN